MTNEERARNIRTNQGHPQAEQGDAERGTAARTAGHGRPRHGLKPHLSATETKAKVAHNKVFEPSLPHKNNIRSQTAPDIVFYLRFIFIMDVIVSIPTGHTVWQDNAFEQPAPKWALYSFTS